MRLNQLTHRSIGENQRGRDAQSVCMRAIERRAARGMSRFGPPCIALLSEAPTSYTLAPHHSLSVLTWEAVALQPSGLLHTYSSQSRIQRPYVRQSSHLIPETVVTVRLRPLLSHPALSSTLLAVLLKAKGSLGSSSRSLPRTCLTMSNSVAEVAVEQMRS